MGQGKLKSGLVVVWCFNTNPQITFPISSQIMSYDVTFQRHAQYSKTREHLIEYSHKFVLCIHNRPYWPS